MKIDPSRDEIFESPANNFYVTEIYKGVIEALNPIPCILRDGHSPTKSSIDKFEQQLTELNSV